jgi:hypothetical protein
MVELVMVDVSQEHIFVTAPNTIKVNLDMKAISE